MERQPCNDDIDGRRGVVGVPEHIALPVITRRHEWQAGDLPAIPADAAAATVDDGEPERSRVAEDGSENPKIIQVREPSTRETTATGTTGGGVEAVEQRPHVGVEGEHEVVHLLRAPPGDALRQHARDAPHRPDAGNHEPPAAGVVQPSELRGELPGQEVGELLRAVPAPRVVVGHQVVVQVVVAAHPHEEDGA